MTFVQGDLNGDRSVNGSDFAILAGNFGKTLAEPQPAAALTSTAAPSAAALPPRRVHSPPRRGRAPGPALSIASVGRRTENPPWGFPSFRGG